MSLATGLRRLCVSYWLRTAAVCLVAAVIVTSLFAIFGGTSSLARTLGHAVIHSVIITGLAAATMPWLSRRLLAWSFAPQWGLTILALLSVAGAGTVLACGVIGLSGPALHVPFQTCVAGSLPISILMTMTVGVGMCLYETQRAGLEAVTLALRTEELERDRAHKMALEARLASLESRLHPHFLFNTLNAISALIDEDPAEAERTVERLAALLRFSLDASARGLVPLAHELKIVTDYLEIERTRLGERLAYVIDVDPDLGGVEIPPLAVQTLVENSVKHAIAPAPGGGHVRVTAGAGAGGVQLCVWDDGPGFTPDAMLPGHGLDNLRGRLDARFGGAASLTVARADGGTRVTITLPRAADS